MNVKKFAAIDIGSNAVRLLISNVTEFVGKEKITLSKSTLVRTPVRLGEEAFINGEISENKAEKLILSIEAFLKLMQVHDVIDYRACATSAMREARNGQDILKEIEKRTGVKIEIISGKEEAEFLFLNKNFSDIQDGIKCLSIDLGGGSIEFNLFTNQEIIASKSFNIGTIRMLKNRVTDDDYKELKRWLKDISKKHYIHKLIGSGGNINKLFKLTETSRAKPLKYKNLKRMYKYLDSFEYEDRVRILKLNTDRADVIMPAANIFLNIMKWLDIKEITVPQIGLSDGIVWQVYNNYIKKS